MPKALTVSAKSPDSSNSSGGSFRRVAIWMGWALLLGDMLFRLFAALQNKNSTYILHDFVGNYSSYSYSSFFTNSTNSLSLVVQGFFEDTNTGPIDDANLAADTSNDNHSGDEASFSLDQDIPQQTPAPLLPKNESQRLQVPVPATVQEPQPRILVTYGGPTHLLDQALWDAPETIEGSSVKNYKYHLNFDYFLRHGVQCQFHDTLIVVTETVHAHYEERIQQLHNDCQSQFGHSVWMITRQPKCLDLEVVRVALYENPVVPNITASYDYFVYINCGVTGPAKELAMNVQTGQSWLHILLQKLQNGVKMTGLSMHCRGPAHIQSMMYAMDTEALKIVMDGGAIFDCEKKIPNFYDLPSASAHGAIVNAYERKMGTLVLHAGYGLDPLLPSNAQPIFLHNESNCDAVDMWIGTRLRNLTTTGRIPFLNETLFFKSSRYTSPELAQEIGYRAKIVGNWDKRRRR